MSNVIRGDARTGISGEGPSSAPTQTDGSGWSQASRGSAGQLGESPVCICALADKLRRSILSSVNALGRFPPFSANQVSDPNHGQGV